MGVVGMGSFDRGCTGGRPSQLAMRLRTDDRLRVSFEGGSGLLTPTAVPDLTPAASSSSSRPSGWPRNMSSVDFPLRREDLTDFISRSSSTSSAKASFDESADEELIELVLTIANPFKNWGFIRLTVSSL